MRMQDKAGESPVDRRWSDVTSDERNDRLQTSWSDVHRITANIDAQWACMLGERALAKHMSAYRSFLGQGSAAARLRLPLTPITRSEQKALIDAL